MNLEVPINAADFLTVWGSGRFERTVLYRGVKSDIVWSIQRGWGLFGRGRDINSHKILVGKAKRKWSFAIHCVSLHIFKSTTNGNVDMFLNSKRYLTAKIQDALRRVKFILLSSVRCRLICRLICRLVCRLICWRQTRNLDASVEL
jgi:hypothetical protein